MSATYAFPSREQELPARCSGCTATSDPRPLGRTPEGWGRDNESSGGRYWCPDCVRPWHVTDRP